MKIAGNKSCLVTNAKGCVEYESERPEGRGFCPMNDENQMQAQVSEEDYDHLVIALNERNEEISVLRVRLAAAEEALRRLLSIEDGAQGGMRCDCLNKTHENCGWCRTRKLLSSSPPSATKAES